MGYTDEELRECLKQLADELGEIPTKKQCDTADIIPSSATYRRRFGSWNAALEAAGLDVNVEQSLSEDELTSRLVAFADRLDGTPTRKQLNKEPELPSQTVYRDRFGSWNEALRAAGLDVNMHILSNDELLQVLQEFATERGETPTQNQYDKAETTPSVHTYQTRFGSWNAAVEAAGLDMNREVDQYDGTDEELLEMLRELDAEMDTSPSMTDIDFSPRVPNAGVFQQRFCGWNAAKREAGLEITERQNYYSDTELISELKRVAQELDREPTTADMSNVDAPSPSTYCRRFDSWNEAKREAGLETTQQAPTQ